MTCCWNRFRRRGAGGSCPHSGVVGVGRRAGSRAILGLEVLRQSDSPGPSTGLTRWKWPVTSRLKGCWRGCWT